MVLVNLQASKIGPVEESRVSRGQGRVVDHALTIVNNFTLGVYQALKQLRRVEMLTDDGDAQVDFEHILKTLAKEGYDGQKESGRYEKRGRWLLVNIQVGQSQVNIFLKKLRDSVFTFAFSCHFVVRNRCELLSPTHNKLQSQRILSKLVRD